jgi:multiple sugar transport system substrate-binding protein
MSDTESPTRKVGRLAGLRRRLRGPLGWVIIGVTITLVALRVSPALFGQDGLEPGDMVILSGADASAGGQRQKLIDRWNDAHPDNHVRIEQLPSNADAQHSEMVARAQGGAGTVDVYNLDVTWVAEFAAAGYIRPMDESVDTTGFLDNPLSTCRYRDQLWALPFNTDAGLLFYRTDVVNRGDLPDRLPPTPDYVDRLSRKDRSLAAYAGQFADYEGKTVNALETIWSAGGDVVDNDGHVVIDGPKAKAGIRRLAEWLRDPKSPGVDSRTYDEDATTRAFQAGQVAMMRNWPVHYGRLDDRDEQAGPPRPGGAIADRFDVAPLPGPSVLGGQDLAVASDTRKPRAAQVLIEFLTSENSQRFLFEDGGFAAARTAVYHDEEVRKQHPYAETLLQAIKEARPRPITPHYILFSSELRRVVDRAVENGGRLPEGAVGLLSDALNGYQER